MTDRNGKPDYLDLYRIGAGQPLRQNAGIVLSACETAWEASGMLSGTRSVSASFLRLGAAYVAGTLWWVADRYAPTFSRAFVGSVLDGRAPHRAYVDAVKLLSAEPDIETANWAPFCLWLGQL